MTDDLSAKVVAWAAEIASCAAGLPSRQARDAYFAERRAELIAGARSEGASSADAAMLADVCVDAARRITTELLAHAANVPEGRA